VGVALAVLLSLLVYGTPGALRIASVGAAWLVLVFRVLCAVIQRKLTRLWDATAAPEPSSHDGSPLRSPMAARPTLQT
jgi:hypothetical protein